MRDAIAVAGIDAFLAPRGIDIDAEEGRVVHGRRQGLRAPHPAQAGGEDEPPRERAPEVLACDRPEGLVRPLHDPLRADVDPRPGGHLPVHHEPLPLHLAEVVPGGEAPDEVGVRDQDARRVRVRAEDRDRLPALYQQRLVVLERAEAAHDVVEGLPIPRRAPGPAVHHEIIGALGDLGVEVVHEHAEGGFLLPPLAGDRGAARRTDGAWL